MADSSIRRRLGCVLLAVLAVVVAQPRVVAESSRTIALTLSSAYRVYIQGQDNGHLEFGCEATDVPIWACTYQIPLDGIQLVPETWFYWGGTHAPYRRALTMQNIEGPHQLSGNGKWEFAEHRPWEATYRWMPIVYAEYGNLYPWMTGIHEVYNMRWAELGVGDKDFDWPFDFGPYIESCLNSPYPQGQTWVMNYDQWMFTQQSGPVVDYPIQISVAYDVRCVWWYDYAPDPPPGDDDQMP